MKTADRNIIDMEVQQSNAKLIETQTLASEQSSIQEDVTQLKSVISKTIENDDENVKEELERIANERKATERVISTDSFDTRNDFEPIVETFSEDDAIVIKPKIKGDGRPTDVQENDYVIEDNTVKNGKLAMINVENDRPKMTSTIPSKSNDAIYTSNEFEDSHLNNKGVDDVTISLETAKVRLAFLIQAHLSFSCFAASATAISFSFLSLFVTFGHSAL